MTAKEYLRQYENADKRANALREEYKREEELIDAVRSTGDIDRLPHRSGIRKVTEERAIRLADKAAELKIAELDALLVRQQVADIIFQMKDSDHLDILKERYINYKQTWEEICVKLNFSWNSIHRKHREALQIVEAIIKTQNLV